MTNSEEQAMPDQQAADIAAQRLIHGISNDPAFLKPEKITGHKLVFRNATVEDAAFIVGLRTDEQKSRFISKTSTDTEQQKQWLEKYARDNSQAYFIIQTGSGDSIGTVRLYDQQADSFCWGSWILQAGAASSSAIESALMVYRFALALGFRHAHFDVRRGNESVWKFHERFGAKKVRETAEDFFFSITETDIRLSLDRYNKFLPQGIHIQF